MFNELHGTGTPEDVWDSPGGAPVECGSLLSNQLYRLSFESQIELRLRSGVEQRVAIAWQRVTTGGAACVRLARDLKEDPTELLRLDIAFRPSIVRL